VKKFLISVVATICLIVSCFYASREVYLSKNINSVNAFSSTASSYYLLEANSGKVLAKGNETEKRKNASTTKILTCITAIENFNNLDQVVTIPKQAVGVEGSSIYLKKNQQIKFIDLLYGLMLRSGNDAATAIAHIVSGSVEDFAKLMNETAQKAGATNSNFVNPHGLDNENHYTTAEDLAKITAYALKNNTFKEITKTSMHKTSCTETTEPQFFYNKNKILHMVDGAIGVKTGYTKKAGRCLVSAAEKDGMQVICVVLNCGPMFEESKKLIEESFNKYQMVDNEFDNLCVNVTNGKYNCACAYVDGKYSELLTNNQAKNIEYKTTINEVFGGDKKDKIIGSVEVFINGNLEKKFDIKLCNDVEIFEEEVDFIDIVKDLVN